jgi:hypothetical protein
VDLTEIRMWECGLDLSSSEYGPVACFCRHINEVLGSIQCGKLLEQLRNYRLHNNDSTPRMWLVRTKLKFDNSILLVQVSEACAMNSTDRVLTFKVLL